MGKFAERAKQLIEAEKYKPIELNEDNVNTIYRRCLPTEDTPKEDIIGSYLFSEKAGFDKNSSPFCFDEKKLIKEFKNIAYILGQLYDVHVTRDGNLYLKKKKKNYMGIPWYNTGHDVDEVTETVFKLIALGSIVSDEDGNGLITPIINEFQACADIDLSPTFSPNDHPAYDEWLKTPEGQKWAPGSK